MKKHLLVSLLVLQAFCLNGQPLTSGPTGFFLNESRTYFSPKGEFLAPVPPAMASQYLVHGQGPAQYVRAIVGISAQAKLDAWTQRGVRFRYISSRWRTADIPLAQLYAVLRSADFTHFEMDSQCYATMDTARAMQDANRVHAGAGALSMPYKGTGVLVGIVDHGFDWSHPAFYSEDGSRYRVLRVWNQHTEDGTAPTDYDYGHELATESEILQMPLDSAAGYHGSHVTGIAAGSGYGSGRDQGMAPDADIALVSSPFTHSSILDGVRYLFDVATELDRDIVVNLSIGGFLGPRDGTSAFDQGIADIVGPGRIVVGACGNEGAKAFHTSKQFVDSQDTLRTILTMDSAGVNTREAYVLMYTQGTGNMRQVFKVLDNQGNTVATSRQFATLLSGMFVGIDTMSWQPGDTLILNADTPRNAAFHGTPWGYLGFAITLKSENPDLYIATHVIRTASGSTIPHLWGGYGAGGRPLVDTLPGNSTPLPGYQAGDKQYTLTEIGGTGRRTISVGNLTARSHFTNIKGVVVANDTSDFGKGSLAHSSSKGPTLDQRTKPDLVATGNSLIAPYSFIEAPIDSNMVVYGFEHEGETRYMGNMWGTSMASPCVTGTVALMLQARPGMDYEQVVNLLRMSATEDEFTNTVPNMHYGYGKLNVYEAVLAAQLTVNRDNRLQEARLATLYPNPGTGSPQLRLLHTQGAPIQLQVLDITGRVLHTQTATPTTPDATVRVDMQDLTAGLYVIRLQQGKWVQTLRYQKVQ